MPLLTYRYMPPSCQRGSQQLFLRHPFTPLSGSLPAPEPVMSKEAFFATSRCNNATLRRAARKLGQFYDDIVAPSGLKATQQGLLYQIHATGQPTMGEIAAALIMDLSALGHTLKPLIRDGYVETV